MGAAGGVHLLGCHRVGNAALRPHCWPLFAGFWGMDCLCVLAGMCGRFAAG